MNMPKLDLPELDDIDAIEERVPFARNGYNQVIKRRGFELNAESVKDRTRPAWKRVIKKSWDALERPTMVDNPFEEDKINYQYSLQYYGSRVLAWQGKVAELRAELHGGGGKKDRNHTAKKIALKKIVANMTMSNNDMLSLFPDVVECMTVQSLEIKKM